MNLRTSSPYWLLKNGIVRSYPSLDRNLKTEVVIMGAGIAGALAAWYLCDAGFKVTVVDRRHAGTGSTAASTSLLQYEIDTSLRELTVMVGRRNAERSYLLGVEAIGALSQISDKVQCADFHLTKSFQYASNKKDGEDLKKEYALRKACGIKLDWLSSADIQSKFGFKAPGGLLSDVAAEVDVYQLSHAIFKSCSGKNFELYDKTDVKHIIHHKKGVELVTANGCTIHAKYLVMACGYESQKYIPKKVQDLNSTYALASEPFIKENFWYQNALIWETARPYLYLRTTADHRIIIGGKDDPFQNPEKRDEALPRKARALERSFSKLFPTLKFKTDFQWAGTFASTKDGLPFIGPIKQRPHTYFALGFGGNGITFSALAGKFISEMLTGKKNPDADIFSFDR